MTTPVFIPLRRLRARVRESFGRQGAMALIGAALAEVEPGYCAIALPAATELTQQHGFVHGGIVEHDRRHRRRLCRLHAVARRRSVVTVEYKINILAPARGERSSREGYVVKPGRTLTITRGEVYAEDGGSVRSSRSCSRR